MNATTHQFVPPYGVPWDTFYRQFDKMKEDGIPLRVDRSYLSDKSGNVQTYLMQALRSFGLVDENHAPLPALTAIVEADEEGRKPLVAALLTEHYSTIVAMGKTPATQGQLEEAWADSFDQRGDTRRKSVRFFLSAAQFSGVPLSKMWKAPRAAPSTGTRRKAATKTDPDADGANGDGTPPPPLPRGDTYTVTLKSGGSVSLAVSVSHFALSKNRDDRTFVNTLIDALMDYGDVTESPAAPGGEDDHPEGDG